MRRLLARAFLPALLPAVLACLLLQAAPATAQVSEEVPFITTPDHVTEAMLALAGVGPSDFVLDLGSGDGRIVITAARRFGARGLGVEIVPELVERSRENARRAGVAQRAEFRVQDLFQTDLGAASVITMYLLPEVNMQLRPALLRLKPGTRIVSHDWDLGDWHPVQTVQVEVPQKAVGREKLSRLHLWIVPAHAEGLWCGAGGRSMRLARHTDRVDGTVSAGALAQGAAGLLRGTTLVLHGHPGSAARLQAQVEGDSLRITEAAGPWAEWSAGAQQPLRRVTGSRCPD